MRTSPPPYRSALLLCKGLLLLVVLGSTTTVPAHGQSAGPTYSLVVRGAPLSQALEQLVLTSGIDLTYDVSLVQDKRTYCVIQDASAEELLACVLNETGVDYFRRSTGMYVLTPSVKQPPRYGTLQGRVVDAATGQPLPNAHLLLADANLGRATDASGRFAFAQLKPGTYQLLVTHLGYDSGHVTVEVAPGQTASATVPLDLRPVLVAPIVIDGIRWQQPAALLGRSEAQQKDLVDLPSAGTPDVLRGLNSLMGVRVNDVTAQVHVQGGEAGEHQFRLDGVPVFIPLNVASFTGPFSPFALGRIQVYKAGFAADQGSQIAGVIDAEHDLSVPERRLDVQVDPMSFHARVGLQRTRPDGRETTVQVASRVGLWSVYSPETLRGYLRDWNTVDTFILSAFADVNTPFRVFETSSTPHLGFGDLHGAARLRFDPLRSLYGSFYWGQNSLRSAIGVPNDVIASPSAARSGTAAPLYRDAYTWQTGVGQVRYESVFDARTLLQTRVRGSYYRLRHDYLAPDSIAIESPEDDGNRIYELGLESTVHRAIGRTHDLEVGTELVLTGSRFVVSGTQEYPIAHNSTSLRWASFFHDALSLGRYTTLEVGSRLTVFPTRLALYAEPRASLRMDVPDTPVGDWSFKVSAGLYRQFVNQFDLSNRSPRALVSTTRFWMSVDSSVAPPKATHAVAELLYRPTPSWMLRVEGYHKKLQHLLSIDYAAETEVLDGTLKQDDFLRTSQGFVRGFSALLERSLGAGSAHVRYEYTLSRRSIAELFGSDVLETPWSEPHVLQAALDLQPWDALSVHARWQSVWGRTWGFRRNYYDYLGACYQNSREDLSRCGVVGDALVRIVNQVEHFNLRAPNEHGLPASHQLDLSLAYRLRLQNARLQLRADALNVLDRYNVAERYLQLDPDTYYGTETTPPTGLLVRRDRSTLPFTPSLALRLSW